MKKGKYFTKKKKITKTKTAKIFLLFKSKFFIKEVPIQHQY